jgi:hypothetical protein
MSSRFLVFYVMWSALMLTILAAGVGFIAYELWKVRRVMRKTLMGEINLK